jgi:hypothetical protein
MTFAVSLVTLPGTYAHTPPWTNIPTYAYVSPSPDVIGIGQNMVIIMFIQWIPPTSFGKYGDRWIFYLDITKPDGKTLTQHWDVVQDTTSIQYYSYVPDIVGTYNLKFDYAGQTCTWPGTYQNDTYAPASRTASFVAQEEKLPEPISSYPLPTEYWTRPIEGQNPAWFQYPPTG